MSKRIVAKTGSYTNKAGEDKNEWQEIGVILSNDGGEYVLLDPTVSLSGVLAKQNILALNNQKNQRDNIMCSVFDDSQQNNQGGQQGQQQAPSQSQQQGGYNQSPQGAGGQQQQQNNQNEPNF